MVKFRRMLDSQKLRNTIQIVHCHIKYTQEKCSAYTRLAVVLVMYCSYDLQEICWLIAANTNDMSVFETMFFFLNSSTWIRVVCLEEKSRVDEPQPFSH